ncbi:Semaphorin-5A [Chelonia mydas]|uniref:Semaphorin-5A n=1 Tax=Chelonia mydas TaxID=8469 RepID=M7BPM9_CHEMY|nr:Semaphorin-5A [Chelonia mydas]
MCTQRAGEGDNQQGPASVCFMKGKQLHNARRTEMLEFLTAQLGKNLNSDVYSGSGGGEIVIMYDLQVEKQMAVKGDQIVPWLCVFRAENAVDFSQLTFDPGQKELIAGARSSGALEQLQAPSSRLNIAPLPEVPEPSPLPPDTTPANQPPDDAMEGCALVQGKRGKRKARALPHLSEAEAPWKTRKGGTDAEPSALPTMDHRAALRALPGNNRETITPPPHELRGMLRKFLEDVRGSRNKVQLALQRWGDFSQIIRATRALMGEAVLFDSFNGDGGNTEAGFGDEEDDDDDDDEVVDSSQQATTPAVLFDSFNGDGGNTEAGLRSKRRNAKTFQKICKAMMDRGFSRDATQCRMTLKELRQAYQKTKESNGCSRTETQTCRFYAELHAILGGAATTTPPLPGDSDDAVLSTMPEDFADREDEKEEDEVEESRQHTILPDSQDLFITLNEIPSQPHQAGEGTSVISAVNEKEQQGQQASAPKAKEAKRLDLLGRKVYSSGGLQLRIANQQEILNRHNFNSWMAVSKFKDCLPKNSHSEFAALIEEGKAVAKTSLQASLDSANSAARTIALRVVMRHSAWLQASGLRPEVQNTLQDVPFEASGLFKEQTQSRLHDLKDSGATLKSLGMHTLATQTTPSGFSLHSGDSITPIPDRSRITGGAEITGIDSRITHLTKARINSSLETITGFEGVLEDSVPTQYPDPAPWFLNRLSHFYRAWSRITLDRWVLCTVQVGYSLQFSFFPPPLPPSPSLFRDPLTSNFLCRRFVRSSRQEWWRRFHRS